MGGGEGETSTKSPKPLAGQEQSPATSSAAAVPVYPDWSNFQVERLHLFLIINRILMEIFFFCLSGRFMFPCVPHKLVISVLAGVSSDSAPWTLPSAIESPGLSLYVGSSGMESCMETIAYHLMPPFGAPPPPYLMYPPRGLYSHPSVPPVFPPNALNGLHPFGPYAMSTTNMNAENSGVVPSSMEMDGKSCKGKEKGPTKRSKGGCSSSNMTSDKNNSETRKSSGPPANEVPQRCIIPGNSTSDSSSEESDDTSQNVRVPIIH
ncbi:hypothetical protein BHM03_00037271 [Ensete ventricosum]|nr:hypothetical protein BHM03_00037271 [Ensete ventricosum]